MQFLSKELVTHDYRVALQKDLAQATVCRFLIAYISGEGIKSINRAPIVRALKDDRSFGVASMSCACKYEPLLSLQDEFDEVRLKYFMDPVVEEKDEPKNVALFHSKLVYIYNQRTRKSIIYLGSHNWTRRALGPNGPRNAEASLRLEFDFEEDHLSGIGNSIPSEVNQHLLTAWDSPLCIPATRNYEHTFEEWASKACSKASSVPLEQNTIVLAVRRGSGIPTWGLLQGSSIYLQILDETDGRLIFEKSNNKLLLMVWESEADLAAGRQPVILKGQISNFNAGANSSVGGSNQSLSPIAGFMGVVFDEEELKAKTQKRSGRRIPVPIRTGRGVSVYDFEFPSSSQDCSAIDRGVDPNYRFLLEIEAVVMPLERAISQESAASQEAELVWRPDSFTVARTRKDTRLEESPGYHVDFEREQAIYECMRDVLLVEPSEAKVLPYSEEPDLKRGKRISKHPLHETYLGDQLSNVSSRDAYYRGAKQERLSAELDAIGEADWDKPIERLQRVYTAPVKDLLEEWRETARTIRSSRKKEFNDDK